MKNKMLKCVKVIVWSVVAIAVATVGCLGLGIGAKAAIKTTAETDVVKYVVWSGDITSYLDNNTAPEYPKTEEIGFGYLFGGWYDMTMDGDTKTYTVIADTDAYQDVKGTVVAKFVPAQTMSVKCQNWAGTKAGDSKVIVRVISAVDNSNYSSYGFKISRIEKNEETGLTTETQLGTYSSETVYSKFNYYEKAEDVTPKATYVPSQIFGRAANKYFSCTVGYIPADHHGTIICIKPFWVTMDGTTVYGLSKFAHVEDGYLGYVNVPVNLNILSAAKGAAAGILDVTSDNDGLTFIGAEAGIECGKVFDQMEFNVLNNGTIRCIGDTSSLDNTYENDIYVNLRFQKTEMTDLPSDGTYYTFTVDAEDFCDKDESLFDGEDVWDVIY